MGNSDFKNYFDANAAEYQLHRPSYPAALFQHLTSLLSRHEVAWDCATGNGQAALGLAPFFKHVIATDASDNQISKASEHPNIEYRVARAECSGIPAGLVDLTTVAQALHWFEIDSFYDEVRRVSHRHAVLATWCYSLFRVDSAVDMIVDEFYSEVVGPYWPPERRLIDHGYMTIPFPFIEKPSPIFFMEVRWNFSQIMGYIGTWSSVQLFKQQNGSDPRKLVGEKLERAWGVGGHYKTVRWRIHLRAGSVFE